MMIAMIKVVAEKTIAQYRCNAFQSYKYLNAYNVPAINIWLTYKINKLNKSIATIFLILTGRLRTCSTESYNKQNKK